MTAVSSPINVYFTRDSAQVAQEKYSNATWHKDCAYVTIVAFAALALVVNVFSLLPHAALIAFDAGMALVGYFGVWPAASEWFSKAENLQAQGDKETQINAKLQELRALAPAALRNRFRELGINIDRLPDAGLQQRPEIALLARVLHREKQADDLARKRNELIHTYKYTEALEVDIAVDKARVKAAFFALLIEHPEMQGKFKDSFHWTDLPAEERALAAACTALMDLPHNRRPRWSQTPLASTIRCADSLVRGLTRDRLMFRGSVQNRLAGDIGRSLYAMVHPDVEVS